MFADGVNFSANHKVANVKFPTAFNLQSFAIVMNDSLSLIVVVRFQFLGAIV